MPHIRSELVIEARVTYEPGHMRSKVQIKLDQLTRLQAEANALLDELKDLRVAAPGAPACRTCGAVFRTDYEFWNHYVVPDERYLNLGECPTKYV
jgi:hypothetical protein